jgi:hypothetical protein
VGSGDTALLNANVSVFSTWSLPSTVVTAELVAANPIVNATPDAVLSSDAMTIEISGTGFNAEKSLVNVTFHNTGEYSKCLAFTPDPIDPDYAENSDKSISEFYYVDPGLDCYSSSALESGTQVTGVVRDATRTRLVVSFYKLNPTNVNHGSDRLNISVTAMYAEISVRARSARTSLISLFHSIPESIIHRINSRFPSNSNTGTQIGRAPL